MPRQSSWYLVRSGKQKLQDVDVAILARLKQAQHHQIVSDRFLRVTTISKPSVVRELVYGMFGIVVIPGDPIIVQKCK